MRVKVKCKVCANELRGFCSIKKSSVSVNKSRKCELYKYDVGKEKEYRSINTTRIGFTEKQKRRAELKKQIKEFKRLQERKLKDELINKPLNDIDTKHPLTGDLSRFTTTVKD